MTFNQFETAASTPIQVLANPSIRSARQTDDPAELWSNMYSLYAGYDILRGPENSIPQPSSLPEIITRLPGSLLTK